jgi:acyl dehydratase
MNFSNIKIEISESYSKTTTNPNIKSFSEISGDNKPIHMSDKYTRTSKYKRKIFKNKVVELCIPIKKDKRNE